MKKITILAVLAIGGLLASCEKEGIAVTCVIPVEINSNETYTLSIPNTGNKDEILEITTQASHFKISKVSPSSNGSVVFEYTPALDYAGPDEVIISGVESGQGKGGHGNCSGGNHHHDNNNIAYDFKIKIRGAGSN